MLQEDSEVYFKLIERAFRLTLSAPEMTVLLGGLRVLKVSAGQSSYGPFTTRRETLTKPSSSISSTWHGVEADV